MDSEKHGQDTARHDFGAAAHQQDRDSPESAKAEDFGKVPTLQNASDLELGPRATYINTGEAAGISQEHRDYLIQRHGTVDLHPLPSSDPADPYNWPSWKKLVSDTAHAY